MGRRSDDAQGCRRSLALEQVGQVREPFADRLGNLPDGRLIGVMACRPCADDRLEAGRSSSNYPLRPRVEATANRLAGLFDQGEIFLVARWAVSVRLQQSKSSLKARDTSRDFTTERNRFGGVYGKQMDHVRTF